MAHKYAINTYLMIPYGPSIDCGTVIEILLSSSLPVQ
jgi:hypothetical protein